VAVVIRLSRHGSKKNPFYRIVCTEKQKKRGGKFLEIVGTYNPMLNPGKVTLKNEKIEYWMNQGAQPTAVVRSLIKKNIPGLVEGLETSRVAKIQTRRKARKVRLAAGSKKSSKKSVKK